MLATDTPDMADRGEMTLGGGPGISLYSFHGRGTLNGVIPHPALVRLFEDDGRGREAWPLQRSRPDRGADRPVLCPARGRGRGLPRYRLSHALFAFRAGDAATSADLDGARRACTLAALARIGAGLQPGPGRLRMSYYLGIDIGTFESKGVLVDGDGPDRRHGRPPAQDDRAAARLGRTPGRGGLVGRFRLHHPRAARRIAASTPSDIRAVAASAIGPCMLPVDAAGDPLMNGVLYGVDTRAQRRDRRPQRRDRRGRDPRPLRQCADLAIGRPEDPLAASATAPSSGRRRRRCSPPPATSPARLTGEYVIDHYTAANFSPLYDVDARRTGASTSPTSARPTSCRA